MCCLVIVTFCYFILIHLPNFIACSLQVKDTYFLLFMFPMALLYYVRRESLVKFVTRDISLHRAGIVLGQKRARQNNGQWEMRHQQTSEKTERGLPHLDNQSSSFTHLIIYSTTTYEHLFTVLSIRGTKMALEFLNPHGLKIFQNNLCPKSCKIVFVNFFLILSQRSK